MEIGMKIYYELQTGNVILNTGERAGSVVPTTREQDFAAFKALNERVPDSVGVIKLEYRQHAQDFLNATGYRVDPKTEKLEFSYEPINVDPPTEPVYQKPLTQQITELSAELSSTQREAADTQLALAELYEKVLAGQQPAGEVK